MPRGTGGKLWRRTKRGAGRNDRQVMRDSAGGCRDMPAAIATVPRPHRRLSMARMPVARVLVATVACCAMVAMVAGCGTSHGPALGKAAVSSARPVATPATSPTPPADDLPPPADGGFHSAIAPVPASVLARSSWTSGCPVAAAELRYVTVSFRGFDGLAHT